MHTHTHTHTHARARARVHACTERKKHTHACTHARTLHTHAHTRARARARTHAQRERNTHTRTRHTHVHTHARTHARTHTGCWGDWVLKLAGAKQEEGFQFGFKRWQGWAVSKVLWEWIPNVIVCPNKDWCKIKVCQVTARHRPQWVSHMVGSHDRRSLQLSKSYISLQLFEITRMNKDDPWWHLSS